MNRPDHLSDKVKMDMENTNTRIDVATEELTPRNTLDHISDKVKIDPNIPNNNQIFMDMSDCMEETHPFFISEED